MHAVVSGVCVSTKVDDDTANEPFASHCPEKPQTTKVPRVNIDSRLDLDTNDATVVAFHDKVHLETVFRAEVTRGNTLLEPSRLLEDLVNDERLQEMPELNE